MTNVPNYIVAPGLMNIDDAVAQVWMIQKSDLQIRTRKREIVEPRQVAMWWRILNTKESLGTIAGSYAKLDHATALHARKTVNNLVKNNSEFRNRVNRVIRIMEKLNGDKPNEIALSATGQVKKQRVIYINNHRNLVGV